MPLIISFDTIIMQPYYLITENIMILIATISERIGEYQFNNDLKEC